MRKSLARKINFATLAIFVSLLSSAPAIDWPWRRQKAKAIPAQIQTEAVSPAQAQSGPPSPDDTARFLAGMPLPKNSALASLTNDAAWVEHATNFETAFAKLNTRQLSKLHAWKAQYFPESRQQVPVAFYMFSGPDFLYVDQFFPKADVYILCGKESMGPPPDPLRITNLAGALHNLEEAMASSLKFSFFITKDMKVDLQSQQLNGTLPIIYVFLARADKTITDVSYGSLSSGGQFQHGSGGTSPGVRIDYIDNHSGQKQTLYYFTTDISDGGLGSSGFLKFCDHFGVGSSLLKASSYLMFESGFNRIRDFILTHSSTIVQDDAGIPITYFNRDKWNIRVFGNYIGPIEIFKQHYQPKLKEIFDQSAPPPIDFNFGYRWNYKESHIIVATHL
jgi:hypothetical protein